MIRYRDNDLSDVRSQPEFWAQPDADMPRVWGVWMNPRSARMISFGMTKTDAEKMAERLNGVGQELLKR
jgi:hypothetical protein